jgi:hypothetical protein
MIVLHEATHLILIVLFRALSLPPALSLCEHGSYRRQILLQKTHYYRTIWIHNLWDGGVIIKNWIMEFRAISTKDINIKKVNWKVCIFLLNSIMVQDDSTARLVASLLHKTRLLIAFLLRNTFALAYSIHAFFNIGTKKWNKN